MVMVRVRVMPFIGLGFVYKIPYRRAGAWPIGCGL